MITINQIKLPINHDNKELELHIKRALRVNNILSYKITKQSIDARDKGNLLYIYSVSVEVENEKQVMQHINNNDIMLTKTVVYDYIPSGTQSLAQSPVIVGTGPAGLFCGLMLAKAGYQPILIEQGLDVDNRAKVVDAFFESNTLSTTCNIQFGEGGAGTFSDGKLNTLVKDKYGRNKKVLEVFVEHGAPKEILYVNKPHIGTDLLINIIKNIREHIIELGGEVHFNTKLTGIEYSNDKLSGIVVASAGIEKTIATNVVVLAIGHSARDTFTMLKNKLDMEAKAFAVGLRIEHPREMINESQYGKSQDAALLPTASYKLAGKGKNGRNVYTFCMCPGGFIVNASSEEGKLAVNGMSNHDRMGDNSNSAIIVNVTPEDFSSDDVLAGMEFQRALEKKAYIAGKGYVPIQTFGDYCKDIATTKLGDIKPNIKGKFTLTNLRDCLPSYVNNAIIDGVLAFDRKIKGFSRKDAILAGVETRTSSPVRILRDEYFESNIAGIYPCGEGAGYAGGITSAAMDGIKVYEAIASKYAPIN